MSSRIITGIGKKTLLLLILLVVAFAGIKLFAVAQQAGQSLEVSPPVQNVKADPGVPFQIKSSITNKSNTTLNLKVRLENFIPMGEQGQVELIAGGPYAVSTYAKLDKTNFTLAPGDTANVTATVTLPKDAAGGRYGSFVFSAIGEQKPGFAALSQEIGSLFLVRISGPVTEKLTLMEFSAPFFSEFGPVPFTIKLKNSGNVHVTPYGLLNITDTFGRKVKDIVIQGTNVFPDSIRILNTQLDNQYLIGKYTANLTLYYGSANNQVINPVLTFYVFPVRIVVAILLIVFVLYLARKRLKKVLRTALGK